MNILQLLQQRELNGGHVSSVTALNQPIYNWIHKLGIIPSQDHTLGLSSRYQQGFQNIGSRIWTNMKKEIQPNEPQPQEEHKLDEEEYVDELREAATADLTQVDEFGQLTRRTTLSLAQSCSGAEVASGHGDHTVRIWKVNLDGSTLRHTLIGHGRTPCSLHYHPLLEHLLASGDLAGEVRIWDTQRGLQLAQYSFPTLSGRLLKDRIASMSWYPSKQQICLGIAHKTLTYFWTMGVKPVDSIQPPTAEPSATTSTIVTWVEQKRKRPLDQKEDEEQKADASNHKRTKLNDLSVASGSTPLLADPRTPPPELSLPLPSDWPSLSAYIHRYSHPHATTNKPISLMKSSSSEGWRYFQFHHHSAAYLLVGEVAENTPEERAALGAFGFKRNSITLRIYTLNTAHVFNHPDTDKLHLKQLASLDNLLFYTENTISVQHDRLVTCQWAPSPINHSSVSRPGVPPRPCVRIGSFIPTLGVFSLATGHLGECLIRLELNAWSFDDLMCLTFSPDCGEFICASYSIAPGARQRRVYIMERVGAIQDANGQEADTSIHANPAKRCLPNKVVSHAKSRFSALSNLTHQANKTTQESTEEKDAASHPATTLGGFPPTPPSISGGWPAHFRPSESYTTLQEEVLESHTFCTIYRAADLAIVRQFVARDPLLSMNGLIWSQQPCVGLIGGTTNGEIIAMTPIQRTEGEPKLPPRRHTLSFPSSPTSTTSATPSPSLSTLTHSLELPGRHSIPRFIYDEVKFQSGQLDDDDD